MPIAKINGIKIFYRTFGKGTPILFIMGLAGDHSGWKKQIEYFKKNYRVIVFDNRGSGKSSVPLTLYTTKAMAEDAKCLLDHLKIYKAHVVGVSMGGMIAQELAIKYPERVNKLVLANTYAMPLSTIKEFVNVNFSEKFLKTISKVSVVEKLLKLVLSDQFVNENPDVFESIKSEYLKNFSLAGLIGQLGATQLHNTTRRLWKIVAKTLVIYGTKDNLIPNKCSRTLALKIDGSKIVAVKNATHAINWEQPGNFNKKVGKFLRSSKGFFGIFKRRKNINI